MWPLRAAWWKFGCGPELGQWASVLPAAPGGCVRVRVGRAAPGPRDCSQGLGLEPGSLSPLCSGTCPLLLLGGAHLRQHMPAIPGVDRSLWSWRTRQCSPSLCSVLPPALWPGTRVCGCRNTPSCPPPWIVSSLTAHGSECREVKHMRL